jgi:hypothetical protein
LGSRELGSYNWLGLIVDQGYGTYNSLGEPTNLLELKTKWDSEDDLGRNVHLSTDSLGLINTIIHYYQWGVAMIVICYLAIGMK